jgi:phage terminase Nu1 subunit (DNA packaging protein)
MPSRRRANKAELAEFFGVSLTSIDRWVSRGCPVVQRGAKGISWVFDLLAVAEWRFGRPDEPEAALDPDRMSPKERKDWFDSEFRRRQLQVQDRELIPVTEHEEAVAHLARQVVMTLETLPDVLERDAGITPAAVERCQRVVDSLRETLAERVADVPG